MIFIGLDLSLSSPGIAVYHSDRDKWLLYAFSQRKSENKMEVNEDAFQLHMFPKIPSAAESNEIRYEFIRHYIIDVIMMMYKEEPDVRVIIESYAFGAKNAGSSYKLQELGGVIKHSIHSTFPTWERITVTPSSWKKSTIGIGNATKQQVVEYVKTHGPCADLLTLLSVHVSKNGSVPCPVQDISDSICIAMSENLKYNGRIRI
jgi:Holliday junction resolvasome RuvABC endonuclease subunit